MNEKFNTLKTTLGNIGENKLLLITSITVMDEYFDTKKKVAEQKEELKKITEKFKELKSLVYDYKNQKESEINSLNKDQINLKNELEKGKNQYESLLDTTTEEIEDFLKKSSSENPIQ